MQFEKRNMGSIILDHANDDPTAACIEQDGVVYTREQIINAASSLRVLFQQHGVVPGSSVAIIAVSRVTGLQAMVAIWSLNAAVLFIDPRQTIPEIETAKSAAGIDFVFTDSKSFARRGGYTLMSTDNAASSCAILNFPIGSHSSPAVIESSSGTTGAQKYRRVSHEIYINGLINTARIFDIKVPETGLSVGSLGFGAVLRYCISLLLYGKFFMSMPLVFKISDLHNALLRPTTRVVGLPPVLVRDLLEFCQNEKMESPVYPHIKRMASLGGPVTSDDLTAAYNLLTPAIQNVYSVSRIGAISILKRTAILKKSESVGKPFPAVTVQILDENGQICRPNTVGAVVATANWKANPEPVNTDDIGLIDDDGYLFIHGRSGQVATRRSININLSELEQEIKQLSSVRDCMAFGVKSDETLDDQVYLAIETRASTTVVKQDVRKALAGYRRPDRIMVTKKLPRNAANKISLRDLKHLATISELEYEDF